jgi:two-component system, NtrC family, sensor histidine kinase HydH
MWKIVVAPVFLVVLLWVAISVSTTFYINWLYDSYSKVLRENVSSIQATGAMQHSLWRLQSAVINAVKNPSKKAWTDVEEWEESFTSHCDDAEQTAFTADEKNIIASIRNGFSAYVDHIQLVKKQSDAKSDDAKLEPGELTRLAQKVADPCNDLLGHNKVLITGTTTSSNRFVSSFYVIRLIFLTAGPLIGIIFGIWVARGLHRSISQIKVVLQSASDELEQEVGHVDILTGDDLMGVHKQLGVVSGHITNILSQLQGTRREVIRAERLAAVGELAAGVAHELRNPLTSVKLLIQTEAQRQPSSPMNDRKMQIIQEEIARMERTIQGLLDFARPPALQRRRYDLCETLPRAVRLVEGRARQQNVTIETEISRSPLWLEGDTELLHQVFVNLLLNGIDSMANGGILQVVVQDSPEENLCSIRFLDQGMGIPKEILNRLFEPFVSSKERGTGLGLAVSQRIVKEHYGTLKAGNRDGGGAIFTIVLPYNAENSMGDDRPVESNANPIHNTQNN